MYRTKGAWTTGIVTLALMAASPFLAAEKYEIDPVHSMVWFKINHLGVSNNYGRFNDLVGSYTLDAENPAASAFEVTIKTESVDTHHDRRDTHLRSPDFFNAAQFPLITLKSKSVKKKGERGYEVVADLSLHGVTKELTLDIQQIGAGADPWGGHRSGFETSFTIKRNDFGINFMPKGLGDDVQVVVGIEGTRAK